MILEGKATCHPCRRQRSGIKGNLMQDDKAHCLRPWVRVSPEPLLVSLYDNSIINCPFKISLYYPVSVRFTDASDFFPFHFSHKSFHLHYFFPLPFPPLLPSLLHLSASSGLYFSSQLDWFPFPQVAGSSLSSLPSSPHCPPSPPPLPR
jgi:hypothetical protein